MSNPEPDQPDLTAAQLVARWRERRREILNTLPADLRAEYQRLGASIKSITGEQKTTAWRAVKKTLDEITAIYVKVPQLPQMDLRVMSRVPTGLTWVGEMPSWYAAQVAWCTANGIKSYGLPDAEAAKPEWAPAIHKAGGPPCFILQNAENYIVGDGKPESFDEMKALVTAYLQIKSGMGAISFRVPLSEHKTNVIAFLKLVESATRGEILTYTGMPEGSLSEVLRDQEFEQAARGRWRLATK